MFTTNTTFQFLTYRTSLIYSHFNKLTYTIGIKNLEGVYLKNLLVKVNGKETCDIVT